MSTAEWIIFGIAWSLIPAVLLMRGYFDRQQRKGEERIQQELQKWIAKDRGSCGPEDQEMR